MTYTIAIPSDRYDPLAVPLIRGWKVLPRRNKTEQHPRDLTGIVEMRNDYGDRFPTEGREGTLVRVANIEESYRS